MGIERWESFLEERIEGFFNKRFASALEPVELAKRLERETARRITASKDERLLPNDYTLCLNVEDYQRLCSQRILGELHEVVEKQAIRQDCFIDGTLRVRMQKQEQLKSGMMEVASCFREEVAAPDMAEPHTLVLERKSFRQPLNLPAERKLVSLAVLEGADREAYLEFGERQIYIGRRDRNDFILTDAKASRVHAYIAYERHRHVIYDAQSLNGTWVNGERTASQCLRSGDRIRIGNTVLLYEVI